MNMIIKAIIASKVWNNVMKWYESLVSNFSLGLCKR